MRRGPDLYFDSEGRTLIDRDVDLSSTVLPESAPTLESEGVSLSFQARPGGGAFAPYVLLLADLAGGTNPSVEMCLYLYFHEARNFSNLWQLIRVGSITDDISSGPSYLLLPTLGAARYEARIRSVAGSPTRIYLHARGINDDQARVLGMTG